MYNSSNILGHIVTYSLTDDEDINIEIKNMFIRTNVRRFKMCSVDVKIVPEKYNFNINRAYLEST